MKNRSLLSIFLLFIILLNACSPTAPLPNTPSIPTGGPIPPTQTPFATLAPDPSPIQPTATVQVTASAPPRINLPLYTLNASFDYNRHFLAVEQTIDTTNQTGQQLSEMVLVVEPNLHPGTFKLKNLKIADVSVNTYALDKNQLKFTLPEPLSPNQSIRLTTSFELSLPVIPAPSNNVRAAIFGFSARQANLVDWYPYIPPYQKDKGWVVHNPWFYGEHQVYEKADYQVEINLIEPPANMAIAAAAQAKVEGSRYTFSHLNARNFTFSASNMYTVYATTVGGTSITSYVFPYDAPAGRTALNDAAKALEVYNRLFGPYPHPSLAVVEADFHDGMEFDGLYFLSKGFYSTYDGTPKGYLTMIGVHEAAHQWWYASIANDQALEPWLDESLATYSELLYYSNVYPDLVKWWWSYRVDYFQPAGWVNLRIYDYTGSYPYRDGVYLRGARFIDQVRQRIGDPAFFAFIKDYSMRNQDRIVTAQNFFDLLRQHSPADLSDIIKTYFKP